MAAKKLGKYILDHDDITYFVDGTAAKKITYSENKIIVDNQDKSELLSRDHHNYIDFKLSFDELNFDNTDDAIEKLNNLVKDISKIEINNPKKSSWVKQFDLPENYNSMNDLERKKYINQLVNNHFKDDNKNIPEILNYKLDTSKKGDKVLKVKLRRTYNRKVSLDDSLISIHTKAGNNNNFEGYKVKPHIHLVIDKNKALGKDFSKLKKELYTLFNKHELTSSHNTYIYRDRNSEEYKEYLVLKDRLTSFSWVLNKHQEGKYIHKQLQQYNRSSNSVKLDNIEDKLNRYLELDGSYDFARKIQINLKEKLKIDIDVKVPENYTKAEQNIKDGNYEEIINDVRNQAINNLKISERYKEYALEILQKDNVNIKDLATAKAIKEVIKNRGFYYDRNYSKIINEKKINSICDNYIEKVSDISYMDHRELQNQVLERITNREYVDQKELRRDLRKAEINNIKRVVGSSEVKIVFEGVEKYVRSNLIYNNYKRTNLSNYEYYKEHYISDEELRSLDLQIETRNIQGWFKEKYPEAIEELNASYDIHEKMQITKQTKDAYLINDEVWIGKSTLEEDLVYNIKDQTTTEEKVTISANVLPIEFYEDVKTQIKNMELDISDNWINQIASKIYREKNINWSNVDTIADVNEQVNILNGLYLSEEQIEKINASVYYDKYSQVKEAIKENLDYKTINPLKSYKNIKKQIEGLQFEISDTWKENITVDIYFEDGFAAKYREEILDKYARVNALKGGYRSVKDNCEELNKKLKDVTGKNRDTVSREIENMQNDTKEIFMILRQLEVSIITLSNKTKNNNQDTQKIDKILTSQEDLLSTYKEKIKEVKSKIEQYSKNDTREPIENNIIKLETDIEDLNKEEYKLVQAAQGLSKKENEILAGYTLQHYEKELKSAQRNINELKEKRDEIKNTSFISKMFGKKENLSEINKKIETEQLNINNYLNKVEKVKSIKSNRAEITQMNIKINEVKKQKNKELNKLKELLNPGRNNKDKNKSMERDGR